MKELHVGTGPHGPDAPRPFITGPLYGRSFRDLNLWCYKCFSHLMLPKQCIFSHKIYEPTNTLKNIQ